MRMYNVGWLLAGSFAVYLGVACASSKGDSGASPKGHEAGAFDAITDALTDSLGLGEDGAVRDATAGPTDPGTTTDTVGCDKSYGGGSWYAEKTFAGRSKTDLARGVAVVCLSSPTTPPGYGCRAQTILVKDGAVAVECLDRSSFSTATIVMPPPL